MNIVMAWGGTKKKRELAESVVNFCIKKLLPRFRTLDICIQLENMDADSAIGYCMAVDKREFVIEVNKKLNIEDFVNTLCHEMVHVRQYATGALAIDGKVEYNTEEEYYNLWYEKEAYAMQDCLMQEYFIYHCEKTMA